MRVYIQSVLFEFHFLYFKIRACIFDQFHFNFILRKINVVLSSKCYHCCYYLLLLIFFFTFYSPKPGCMKKSSTFFLLPLFLLINFSIQFLISHETRIYTQLKCVCVYSKFHFSFLALKKKMKKKK